MYSVNVIENELHFMMDCPLYNDLRYDLINQMKCYITDFTFLPQIIQACEFFNEKHVHIWTTVSPLNLATCLFS